MKLKVSKEKILNSLQKVQSVVSTRTTLPILSNVLIKAEKDRIHFTATDLDVSVVAGCEAQVSKPGATTLPARRIFSIFKELPGPDVEVEVDDKNQASIRSGGSFFKLVGAAEADFVIIVAGDPAHPVKASDTKFPGRLSEREINVYSAAGNFRTELAKKYSDKHGAFAVTEKVVLDGISGSLASCHPDCSLRPQRFAVRARQGSPRRWSTMRETS